MTRTLSALCAALLLSSPLAARSQTSPHDYWVAFKHDLRGPNSTYHALTGISLSAGNVVRFDYDHDGTIDERLTLGRGEGFSNDRFQEGTRITSSAPLQLAYAYNFGDYSTYEDGALAYELYPQALFGTDHWLPVAVNRLAILSPSPGNRILVDTNADGIPEHAYVLGTGRTVRLPAPAGTRITSSSPVNVVAVHHSDTRYDQTFAFNLLPVHAWSDEYHFPKNHPHAYGGATDRSGVFVVAAQDDTRVTVGGLQRTLRRGEVWHHESNVGGGIHADKPVMAVFRSRVQGRDPWAGSQRFYDHTVTLMPSSLAATEFVVGASGTASSHGSPALQLAVVSLADNNEVRFDCAGDGSVDLFRNLRRGQFLYFHESDALLPCWSGQSLYIRATQPLQTILTSRGWWNRVSEGTSGYALLGNTTGRIQTNSPPTLSEIHDQQTREDTPVRSIAFRVSDAETAAQDLRLSVTSSNPTLVDPSGIHLAGTGTDRSLDLVPFPDQFGQATLTLAAVDADNASASVSFQLTVLPVNDPPSFVPGSNIVVIEGSGPVNIPSWAAALRAGPPDESGQRLAFDPIALDRPEWFSDAPALSADGMLQFTPAPGAHGVATLSARLRDDGGTDLGGADVSPVHAFLITIQPTNRPPQVELMSPSQGQSVPLGTPVAVRVRASDPDDGIAHVDLQPQGVALTREGFDTWTVNLAQLQVGTHTIQARARDSSGLTTISEARSFEVIDPDATVALIGWADQPEVACQRASLEGIQLRSRVFAPDTVRLPDLEPFRLILWSQTGRRSVSSHEIRVLLGLRERGQPLYFIGDRLASAASALSPADQAAWHDLTGLRPASSATAGGGSVLHLRTDGYFGFAWDVLSFAPLEGFEPALAAPNFGQMAVSDGADVLLGYPQAGEPDLSSGFRSITQNFPVCDPAGSGAYRERQLLLEAIVCWLLHCNRCAAFNLVLDDSPAHYDAGPCGAVEILVPLYQRFACVSTGVRVDVDLSDSLKWSGFTARRGFEVARGDAASVWIGQMAADERLDLRLRVTPARSGLHQVQVHVRSNESAHADSDTSRTITVAAVDDPCPRLEVARKGPNLVLRWPASARGWQLESATSLGAPGGWQAVGGAPVEAGDALTHTVASGPGRSFFRLRRSP